MMQPEAREAIGRSLGQRVRGVRPLGGGDINEAYLVELSDGRRLFAKCNRTADKSMFPSEAKGLEWLGEARALRVPRVLAVSNEDTDQTSFLVLEYLEPGRRSADFEEQLGRGLARLHRFGAQNFGLDHDNFIGSLPQCNRARSTWPEFFRRERLEPQLERAEQVSLFTARHRRMFDALFDKLDDLCGPAEPPSRLHGDLWGGNLHVDDHGAPALIDPAVYAGHREMDLAMMQLFGGFGERVFAAYDEAYPRAPGHRDRVPLYQLYPLMVHVNLFGTGYVGSVERALSQYL